MAARAVSRARDGESSPSVSVVSPRGAARFWLERIHALNLREPLRIMNVCGGHERTITHAGLRAALPQTLELIPGPGCPVCVCPEEDVYHALRLALDAGVILVAFGDMLRVPVNVARGEPRSLEEARARGADVRAIASPQEAVAIARAAAKRQVVFFAAGFETTMAPVAALVAEGLPENLSLLVSGRLTWPVVSWLLAASEPGFDALIAPGHVATVMGPEEWAFVAGRYGLPVAVAGFTPAFVLAAIHAVLLQRTRGQAVLENCYAGVVRAGGNPLARSLLAEVMRVTDAAWRGIGVIPASGVTLSEPYRTHDARHRFPLAPTSRRRAGEMPPGCDCAEVVLGRRRPDACRLFGQACTPRHPVGPCMVSEEGACRIWWAAGIRRRAQSTAS